MYGIGKCGTCVVCGMEGVCGGGVLCVYVCSVCVGVWCMCSVCVYSVVWSVQCVMCSIYACDACVVCVECGGGCGVYV